MFDVSARNFDLGLFAVSFRFDDKHIALTALGGMTDHLRLRRGSRKPRDLTVDYPP